MKNDKIVINIHLPCELWRKLPQARSSTHRDYTWFARAWQAWFLTEEQFGGGSRSPDWAFRQPGRPTGNWPEPWAQLVLRSAGCCIKEKAEPALPSTSSAIRWNGRLAMHKPAAQVSLPRRRI